MNESTRIRVGDRVIIREGYTQGLTSSVVGRVGEVTEVLPQFGRTRYTVRTPHGYADRARRVDKVQDVPDYSPPVAAVGDKVVITRTNNLSPSGVGTVGTVESIVEPYKVDGYTSDRVYRVKATDGSLLGARLVAKVAEPAPVKTVDPPPVELPMRNLQAATFAHQLLGDDADLDKLIGVAEFVMGSGGEKKETPTAPAQEPEDLSFTDQDGDRFQVEMAWPSSAGLVCVSVNGKGVWVDRGQALALENYLRQARLSRP